MKRKTFLKGLGWSSLSLPLFLGAKSVFSQSDQACEPTATETAGPFRTKNPASLRREDIRADRQGIDFDMELTILDRQNDCKPYQGVQVDVWHCDKDGHYSEYGGIRMQQEDFTDQHFLRGRQTTNGNGQVAFRSIFPGWYPGRSTHIHVEVFDKNNKSLLVTQIAFPEGKESAVEQVNLASEYGYTKGMNGYTQNSRDGVFRDGIETEMGHVSGSITDGFELRHSIFV